MLGAQSVEVSMFEGVEDGGRRAGFVVGVYRRFGGELHLRRQAAAQPSNDFVFRRAAIHDAL